MEVLTSLIASAWPWLLGAGAFVMGLFLARRSGQVSKEQEIANRVAQQQIVVSDKVKVIENELSSADPSGSRDRSARWVRGKNSTDRR